MNRRTAVLAGVVSIATLAVAGCGQDQSRVDAHDVPNSAVDRTPPQVMTFSNHYPNVENKCDGHGHRVFVATHDSATGRNIIIMPDPTCPGFVKNAEPSVSAVG